MFTVTIEGLAELERALAEGDRALSDGVRRGVAAGVEEGAAEARKVHKYKDKTGNLTRSIDHRVEVSTPGGATGVIVAEEPYASFVDGGTAPHKIYPKAARGFVGPLPKGQSRGTGAGGGLLKFVGRDGQWRSVREVDHPGTNPDGFMGKAYQKAERVLVREIEVAVAQAQKIVER